MKYKTREVFLYDNEEHEPELDEVHSFQIEHLKYLILLILLR
jgi:hypothetical protein